MLNLKDLGYPSEFWEYFEQITKIPRCSEHEERVRAFIKKEAKRLGFKIQVDNAGNLVVKTPVESKPKQKVVLQCHMDMVCEKNEDISHNFSKDPLKLKIIEINDEKWLTAEGTTLGADNGVGICYLLTLIKKIHNGYLDFGSLGLEFLFTVEEETGLKGAFEIDENLVDGNYLINLDSESEDSVIIGCAGGKVTIIDIKNETFSIKKTEKHFLPIKLFISGLIGGHSGVDINLGRGNALKIISQILWKINAKYLIHLGSINGGNRTNAIPREASAIFFVKEDEFTEIRVFIEELFARTKVLFEGIEPHVNISIELLESYSDKEVFSKRIQDNLLNVLYTIPTGPLSMHPKIPDLVFTSTNLAVIKTGKNNIVIKIHQRSLSEYFKSVIWEKAKALFELTGLEISFTIDSDYPGWTPDFNSRVLTLTKNTYKELFKKEINVKALHAGLECGILKKKFPKMEMISIGPTNIGPHSPNERLSIKSVEKIWNFLLKLLEKLI